MGKAPHYENHINQTVIMQLHLALRSLDILGYSIAAAHVDAAIQDLKSSTVLDIDPTTFDASFEPSKTKTDVSGNKYTLTQPCNAEVHSNSASLEIGMTI